MEEKIWIKTEVATISDEDRSDAFDYPDPVDIKYDPLAIKQELVEIAEVEDGSVQVGNILIAKAEVESDIKMKEIGYGLSALKRKCDICGKCFTDGLDLIAHKYAHTEDTYYTCCICKCNTFHLKPDLHRHILNVHFNLTSQLAISAKLNSPKPSNSREKSHECVICQKRFARNQDLTVHNRIHSGEKPYKCDICSKRFTTSSSRSAHRRIHSDEKPHQCDICQKQFLQSSNLARHKRRHSGEKPYECDICHKRFKNGLVRHKYVHSTEKPYECNLCNKRFISAGDLTRHIRIHSGEQPYECDTCQKRFNVRSDLTAHNRIHTNENPYECDICNKRFKWKSSLKAHKRMHTSKKSSK